MNTFDNIAGSITFTLPLPEAHTDADLENNEKIVKELTQRALDLLRDDEASQVLMNKHGIQIGRITITCPE